MPILAKGLDEILYCVQNKEFERAYDLVDALHAIPEALLDTNNWNEKSLWQYYIHPNRKKWNNDFLVEEETSVSLK